MDMKESFKENILLKIPWCWIWESFKSV